MAGQVAPLSLPRFAHPFADSIIIPPHQLHSLRKPITGGIKGTSSPTASTGHRDRQQTTRHHHRPETTRPRQRGGIVNGAASSMGRHQWGGIINGAAPKGRHHQRGGTKGAASTGRQATGGISREGRAPSFRQLTGAGGDRFSGSRPPPSGWKPRPRTADWSAAAAWPPCL